MKTFVAVNHTEGICIVIHAKTARIARRKLYDHFVTIEMEDGGKETEAKDAARHTLGWLSIDEPEVIQ